MMNISTFDCILFILFVFGSTYIFRYTRVRFWVDPNFNQTNELHISSIPVQNRFLCLAQKRVTVLGDSQLKAMYFELLKMVTFTSQCKNIRFGGRCEDHRHLNLSLAKQFVTPEPSVGPVHHGLVNLGQGCRDCAGCDALLRRCSDIVDGKQSWVEFEFLAIEFAKDVSIQTEKFKTTQENIILDYFSREKPDFVIFNTGLHDTALNDSSPERYKCNLQWYLRLLLTQFKAHELYWIHTVSVRNEFQPEKWRNITKNYKIYAYNQIAQDIMESVHVRTMDPFSLLLLPYFQNASSDGVHYFGMDHLFYKILSWETLKATCNL